MLVGTYYHSLETKGRFSLPKAFRGETKDWVLTTGLDGCLFAFKAEDFNTEVAKLQKLSYFQADNRAVVRHLVGNACPQSTDNLGRLSIPANLQAAANLSKQIVIVGAITHVEIWDSERYREMMDKLESTVEDRAEMINLEE